MMLVTVLDVSVATQTFGGAVGMQAARQAKARKPQFLSKRRVQRRRLPKRCDASDG